MIRQKVENVTGHTVPGWLSLDAKELKGSVTQMPTREDVALPINEAFIVEFCSR